MCHFFDRSSFLSIYRAQQSKALLVVLAALQISSEPAAAQVADEVLANQIIYIECTRGTDTIAGTGVVVSDIGEILTARHVLEPLGGASLECVGRRGSATAKPATLNVVHIFSRFDLAVLKSSALAGPNNRVTFCPMDGSYRGKNISVAGFDKELSQEPLVTEGTINSTSNEEFVFRTDALTSKGRSGGGVFLLNSTLLVGIVKGAKADRYTGFASSFDVTEVSPAAEWIRMRRSPSCPHDPYNTSGKDWDCEPMTGRCRHVPTNCVIEPNGKPLSGFEPACIAVQR